MSSVDKTILAEVKPYIERGVLSDVQHLWRDLQQYEYEQHPDWIYLFQKIYIHACLKKHVAIAEWLKKTIYPQMDPVHQIALRPVFPYGRYLLRK